MADAPPDALGANTPAFLSRPAIHELCRGVFLQDQVQLPDNVLLTPLTPLERDSEVAYCEGLAGAITGVPGQLWPGKNGPPAAHVVAISLMLPPGSDANLTPERSARIRTSESLLTVITGSRPNPFALICASESTVRAALLRSKLERQRFSLGPGNQRSAIEEMSRDIASRLKDDRHFSFALALFENAAAETDSEFKIALLFDCLEALAYRLKGGDVGSRQAVRQLFPPDISYKIGIRVSDQALPVDVIEVAGRVRDKIFHGVPFSAADLKPKELQQYYEQAAKQPLELLLALEEFCRLHLVRWARGLSPGQQ